jgi:hypothetical protein
MCKLYGHPRFYEILEEMKTLHSNKNHDYAGQGDPLQNFRECGRIGIDPFIGCFVRMQDKYMRIINYINSGKLMVKGEGVKDTLTDLAVYSIIAIILLEEKEQ